MKNEKIKIGYIGLGPRGLGMLNILLGIEGIEIVAVCDVLQERIDSGVAMVKKAQGDAPLAFSKYQELLAIEEIEAVVVATTWVTHAKIAVAAMKAGKHVASEVGGAASEGECWNMVRTSEETGKFCMLLENICYAENELAIFNMERLGRFGEIIHTQGGYQHDLRHEIALGRENKHGRLANFMHRNGELYPTHQLGPIAKLLRINRGNRFVSLTSMASKARGLKEWIIENKGADYDIANYPFNQADIVTTMIKCANGETITLVHDCTLPRPYSRHGRVQGTKGLWMEDGNMIYIDGISPYDAENFPDDPHRWQPFGEVLEQFRHPLWQEYHNNGIKSGHGGVDFLVLSAFVDSVKNNTPPPIDVYDAASWMAITYLSEQSVTMGSMPVAVPDFTNGEWIEREPFVRSKYCLEEVCHECFEE